MKYLTSILAMTILILALKPGLDLLCLHMERATTCCAGSCQANTDFDKPADDHQEKKDCNSSSCNPFQVCCSGILLSYNNPLVEFFHPEFSTAHNFTYQSAFSSLFTTEFWQPPRLAKC